jgi:hypothetical protein
MIEYEYQSSLPFEWDYATEMEEEGSFPEAMNLEDYQTPLVTVANQLGMTTKILGYPGGDRARLHLLDVRLLAAAGGTESLFLLLYRLADSFERVAQRINRTFARRRKQLFDFALGLEPVR